MEKLNRIIKGVPCMLVCAAIFSPVHAAVLFQGNATGSFSNPLAASGSYSRVWNHDAGPAYWYASTFDWGTVEHKTVCGGGQCQMMPVPLSGSSQLLFDGAGSDVGDARYQVGLGPVFSLGMLKYTNMPTYFSDGVTGVDLSVNVNFGNLNMSRSFTYHAAIDNTWNGPGNTPDTVSFSGVPSPFQFDYAGNHYRFSLLGFSSDGGATFANSFTVDEGQFVRAELYGRFENAGAGEVTAVPVPGALGVFGSGLIGLLGAARRARRNG